MASLAITHDYKRNKRMQKRWRIICAVLIIRKPYLGFCNVVIVAYSKIDRLAVYILKRTSSFVIETARKLTAERDASA